MVAIRQAARAVGNWRLTGLTLVVTLEPCTMCAGAVTLARLGRLVYGAQDPKAGAAGSLWDVLRDRRLNHRPEVIGGILAGLVTTLFVVPSLYSLVVKDQTSRVDWEDVTDLSASGPFA